LNSFLGATAGDTIADEFGRFWRALSPRCNASVGFARKRVSLDCNGESFFHADRALMLRTLPRPAVTDDRDQNRCGFDRRERRAPRHGERARP
jgi:hypothetical protein